MNIFEIFYASRNEENSIKMAAYIKNKIEFIGIAKPERVKLSKDFLLQMIMTINVNQTL